MTFIRGSNSVKSVNQLIEGENFMCGIVGYIGDKNAAEILVEGLRHLEYRGYDSSGVAVLNGGPVELRRSIGKLNVLEEQLKINPANGTLGIGHTRWATHGRPTVENAHPHACCDNRIFVAHNGIIENYDELKQGLVADGHVFKSQTDTEVLAHLIERHYDGDLLQAVRTALAKVKGSYAVGVVSEDHRDQFIAARKDSPLIIGIGDNETFVASDVAAVLRHTRKVIFLEDGDIADIARQEVHIFDINGLPALRIPQTIEWDANKTLKSGYAHFMLKEIHEQPETVQNTLRGRVRLNDGRIDLQKSLSIETARSLSKICLVGCGTSYHAGLVARYWMEEMAGLPCDVEIASEFRYLRAEKDPNTLVVAISQSGETADTLAALRKSKAKGLKTLALCNVIGSSVARDAEHTLLIQCGPEIGVASTKAFTGQLIAMHMLTLYLARLRKSTPARQLHAMANTLAGLSRVITETLKCEKQVAAIARSYYKRPNFLFVGRNVNYPIAMEGALKLKEISYIHAEGYPAGELKHGPIALIDRKLPIVAIATDGAVYEKMLSNIEEAKSRGADAIVVATKGNKEMKSKVADVVFVPDVPEDLTPLVAVIPLQLLAYHISVLRGCDVDQPRNLAKSVTVE
jgi:glucosamine--fructose-6-phosphate aminotransferase (isomerizing)